jgi:hypothetical protein
VEYDTWEERQVRKRLETEEERRNRRLGCLLCMLSAILTLSCVTFVIVRWGG